MGQKSHPGLPLRTVGGTVAAALACATSVEVTRLALLKRFSIDEFQYAHAAWLVSHGHIPYRDFFEFHFPLPYLLYSFFIGDAPTSIRNLRWFMLFVVALTCVALYRISYRHGKWLALAAPLVALTSPPFVFFATEIRPDSVSFCLMAATLSLLFPAPSGRWRSCAVGSLLVLSVFASQKMVICEAPLAGILLLSALRTKSSPRLLGAPLHFFLGAGAGASVVLAYLCATHSMVPWFEQTIRWALHHERSYPGFSWTVYGVPALEAAPILVVLGLVGVGGALVALPRSSAALASPDLVLVLVTGSSLYSFGFARAPYPYALLPGLGMLCVFVPQGLQVLLLAIGRLEVRPWLRIASVAIVAACLVVLGPLDGFRRFEEKLAIDNTYQYRVLSDVARTTKVTDPVYDNSGGYVSRPHIGFRYYTNALDRLVEAAELPYAVSRAIHQADCTAFLLDLRFAGLPPALRRFFLVHFQPYNADLWLWGQQYSSFVETRTFDAVRDATYFVEPAQVAREGALWIDGTRIGSPEFRLTRGIHSIEYTGAFRRFFILWLPADGQRYEPSPERRLRFSTLF